MKGKLRAGEGRINKLSPGQLPLGLCLPRLVTHLGSCGPSDSLASPASWRKYGPGRTPAKGAVLSLGAQANPVLLQPASHCHPFLFFSFLFFFFFCQNYLIYYEDTL